MSTVAVAFGVAEDGRPVLVSGHAGGEMRLWDPHSGDQLLSWEAHNGPVDALVFGSGVAGKSALASSGSSADGLARTWHISASKKVPDLRATITGGGRVLPSLALAGPREGRSVLATLCYGGSRLRFWDAETGEALSEIGVLNGISVASAIGSDENLITAVGTADGVIYMWYSGERIPGQALGRDLPGPRSPVNAVAFATFRSGPVLVAEGSGDGYVQMWDPMTGEQRGVHVFRKMGHPVTSVAFTTLPGDIALVVAGFADGQVCLSEIEPTGYALPEPTGMVHKSFIEEPLHLRAGAVKSVALALGSDDHVLLATSGEDGRIHLYDLMTCRHLELGDSGEPSTKRIINGFSSGPDPQISDLAVTELTVTDDVEVDDALGREILAAYLDGLLVRAEGAHRSRTAVIHLDGQWGAGKSTLVRLLLNPDRCAPSSGIPKRKEQARIVVWYDAWRESAIAPEWWSLASGIHRKLRSQRSWFTRATMTMQGTLYRLKTPSTAVFAAAVLVLLLLGKVRPLWSLEGLATSLPTLAALISLLVIVWQALVTVGHAMFWSAPAFGQIHLRSSENPLAGVAAEVSRLRRWAPRNTQRQRRSDTTMGIWTVVWSLVVGLVALAGLTDAVTPAWLAWFGADSRMGWIISFSVAMLVLGFVGYAYKSSSLIVDYPHRPPVLLVVDDLDRCAPDRVVRLLETIHTLLREPGEPKSWRKWREPAALLVLVLADGRWVRSAFETVYSDYRDLGSPPHGLGSDFIQKMFDHTIMVPELTADQTRGYLSTVTEPSEGRYQAAPPKELTPWQRRQQRMSGQAERIHNAVAEAKEAIENTEPQKLYENQVTQKIEQVPDRARVLLNAQRAGKAASSEEVVRANATHLLNNYAHMMPANPRLLKRVADTWGMLRALRDHLKHDQPDETLVIASIVMVRFPRIVESLLTDISLPDESVAHSDSSEATSDDTYGQSAIWLRSDVRQVIGSLPARELARCFGREFPPDPT